MSINQLIVLLVILQLAQLAGLLFAAHHIWDNRRRLNSFIEGNIFNGGMKKEKLPNGQWMLDVHHLNNLEHADQQASDRLERIEKVLRQKYGDNWPFIVARD